MTHIIRQRRSDMILTVLTLQVVAGSPSTLFRTRRNYLRAITTVMAS